MKTWLKSLLSILVPEILKRLAEYFKEKYNKDTKTLKTEEKK